VSVGAAAVAVRRQLSRASSASTCSAAAPGPRCSGCPGPLKAAPITPVYAYRAGAGDSHIEERGPLLLRSLGKQALMAF
jgi:hypothetical protein